VSGSARGAFVSFQRWFLSRNAAVAAMAVMGLLLAVSGFVPTPDLMGEREFARLAAERPFVAWLAEKIRPQAMVSHPAFLLFPLYLSIGIGFSLYQRLRMRMRRGKAAAAQTWRFRQDRGFDTPATPPEFARILPQRLRGSGFAAVESGPFSWSGEKGAKGFWGSVAFHIGLLLVFIGVAASSRTRLHGEIVLTEGFVTPLNGATLLNRTGVGELPDEGLVGLSMRDFAASYTPQGSNLDFSALLAVHRGGSVRREAMVRVNDAFVWEGTQFTLHRYGFAPAVVATNPAGERLADGVGLLQLLPPGAEDSLQLTDGGELVLSFYPDFAVRQGKPVARSLNPVRPVLAFRWRDASGAEVAAGRVRRGESASVNGYRVEFPALSYWAGFLVARDGGLWFFAFGSILASLGLALRMLFPDQSLRLTWEPGESGSRVRMSASTRYFPALHEEQVERLLARLTGVTREAP